MACWGLCSHHHYEVIPGVLSLDSKHHAYAAQHVMTIIPKMAGVKLLTVW